MHSPAMLEGLAPRHRYGRFSCKNGPLRANSLTTYLPFSGGRRLSVGKLQAALHTGPNRSRANFPLRKTTRNLRGNKTLFSP